jgi:hypothetical protein
MDYKRLALAAVVAWVVDSVYSFVVYMNLFSAQMSAYPGVFRSQAGMNANAPLMLVASLVAFLALAWIYAKGYGGRGIGEGLRFGVTMGVFITGFISVAMYGTLNIGGRLGVVMSAASFVELLVVGLVLGAVYRPVGTAKASRAMPV